MTTGVLRPGPSGRAGWMPAPGPRPRQGQRAALRRALVITRREIRDQLRDWRIIFPIVVLTLFFPFLMDFTAHQAVSFVETYGAPVIAARLFPFLLMVVGFFPISVSLVIALESFVGEKERHSLEPLLASPLSATELYMGKMLAAIAPPLAASYLGIGVYLTGLYLSLDWLPDGRLLAQILALTTVQALVMVAGAVVVSTQTTSVRAANLLASFIIIPMALLVQLESLVMFWARYDTLWWIIAGLLLVVVVLVRMGVRLFNREELLGRDLDEINLRWGWRVFKRAFVGQAHSPPDWYRRELTGSVRRLRTPALLICLALVAGYLIGIGQAARFVLPAEFVNLRGLGGEFTHRLSDFGLVSGRGVLWVLLTNTRAIALASLLGIFSFGVASTIVLMLPLSLTGYFAATVAAAGYSPWLFLAAFILPHGWLEIPAIILAGAVILRLGTSVLSPPPGLTVGEGWLRALAEWARVVLGLVLPLLLAAATLEVLVTPRVVLAVFGH